MAAPSTDHIVSDISAEDRLVIVTCSIDPEVLQVIEEAIPQTKPKKSTAKNYLCLAC